MSVTIEACASALLAGLAVVCFLAIPVLLKQREAFAGERDIAWRDRLPFALKVLRPIVRLYAATVDESLSTHKRDVLQAQLYAAGAGYLLTPAELVVLRRLGFVMGAGVGVYVIFALHVHSVSYLAIAAALAPLGYFYPEIALRDATKRRHALFDKEFPFFLDVLVLSMRAGLTFTGAVEQAHEPLRAGPVRDEVSRYLREVRTGVARRVALDRLAARVDLPSVTNFVASVSQAEEIGGSLGDVLADQARLRRQERFLRAEKLANQAPVKMLFPLIAFLFPVTFIIIGFPIAIQLLQSGAFRFFK